MFNALRKMIFPIIVVVLLFFVAMIVLQWGLDLTGQGRFATARYAGIVNGEEISWDAFQSVYSNLYQNAAAETDEELPESKLMELETTAWNQLLQEHLLLITARAHRSHHSE